MAYVRTVKSKLEPLKAAVCRRPLAGAPNDLPKWIDTRCSIAAHPVSEGYRWLDLMTMLMVGPGLPP